MPFPGSDVFCGFEQKVVVGVGDLAVSNSPGLVLAAYSLGSCIGLTVFDPVVRVGGLLHLMLPDSSLNPSRAAQQPGMFADSGIPALFRTAYQMNAGKHRMLICLAGGAQIMDPDGAFNIGRRNQEAVAGLLQRHGLKVHAARVGGSEGRTLMLDVRSGRVWVRDAGHREESILCGEVPA
jgi:chemotaxis protein CheD